MEGYYRIVQLSENEFVIEKEVICLVKYPWYKFKKNIYNSLWYKVDIEGKIPNYINMFGIYKTSDLKVAQKRLEEILKYPKVIEYATL